MKLFNRKLVNIALIFNVFWYVFYYLSKNIVVEKKITTDSNTSEILILDFHFIGDIVLLIPFLRAIKKSSKNCRITLVCGPWAKEVLSEEGLVDSFIFFIAPWVKYRGLFISISSVINLIKVLRATKWDLAIDIRGDIRQILLLYLSGSVRRVGFNFMGGDALLTDIVLDDGEYHHLLKHHQNILSALNIHIEPGNFIPKISLSKYEQHLSDSMSRYVGVHFGASLRLRRLPVEEQIKLLNKIALAGKQIVIFVPPDDRKSAEHLLTSVPLTTREFISLWSGSLREMIVKISVAERFYGMDSGAAHISAALGVPTTVLFGPNLPSLVAPIGPNVEVFEKVGLKCRPCNQVTCTNSINQFCLIDIV